jgi:hypothetical protein
VERWIHATGEGLRSWPLVDTKAAERPANWSSDGVGVARERCLTRGAGRRDTLDDAEKLGQGARRADELRFDPIPVTAPRYGIRNAHTKGVQLRGAGASQSQAKSLFGRIPPADELGEIGVAALERGDVGGKCSDVSASDRKARASAEVTATDVGRRVQEIAGRVGGGRGGGLGQKSKRERGVQRLSLSK